MKELNIEELRKVQIDILNTFDDFCVKNGLTYFLSNGTLLGAIKYKGFIPWDDDVDVCMPRKDYELFIKLYTEKNKTNNRYQLFSLENEQKYYFPFAKLSDTNTLLIEKNVNNGVELGVNIDIFPLDNFGDDEKHALQTYKKMDKLRGRLNFAKLKVYSGGLLKSFIKRLVSFSYKIINGNGAKYYSNKINKKAQKLNNKPCALIGNVVWGFYSNGEAHANSVFKNSIKVEFEGREYFAPSGYNAYLTRLYGDYKKDPPKEKQITHHSFVAYLK